MKRTSIVSKTGLFIIPADRYNKIMDFINYTQAHAEALLDECVTIRECFNDNTDEIKVISCTSDKVS